MSNLGRLSYGIAREGFHRGSVDVLLRMLSIDLSQGISREIRTVGSHRRPSMRLAGREGLLSF